MQPASYLREGPGPYWVLAENESESSPGKVHEVRTSKRDGKTYCTCRGWIAALNAGHSICCHIAKFNAAKPAEKVAVMNKEDFASFRRGIVINTSATLKSDIAVRRK